VKFEPIDYKLVPRVGWRSDRCRIQNAMPCIPVYAADCCRIVTRAGRVDRHRFQVGRTESFLRKKNGLRFRVKWTRLSP
jgi:hypothetical protein